MMRPMTNQQLKAHCEDVIANPQDHRDWVVNMARVALASLEAVPLAWICKDGADAIKLAEQGVTCGRYVSIHPNDADSFADRTFIYTSPPVAVMQPVVLPAETTASDAPDHYRADNALSWSNGFNAGVSALGEAIRAAGGSVKE